MNHRTNEINRLKEAIQQTGNERDALNTRIAELHVQLRRAQAQEWEARTGIRLGAKLAATSSFMKYVRQQGNRLHQERWTWEAEYHLGNLSFDGDITCSIINPSEVWTVTVPEWVVIEMAQKWQVTLNQGIKPTP